MRYEWSGTLQTCDIDLGKCSIRGVAHAGNQRPGWHVAGDLLVE